MSRDFHRDAIWDAGSHKVAGAAAAKVMDEESREPSDPH